MQPNYNHPMTRKEHAMMITRLAQQYQRTKTIVDILKSRDLITHSDFKAFVASVEFDEETLAVIHERATMEYVQAGIASGALKPEEKL